MAENNTSLAKYISEQGIDPVRLHLGCGGDKWRDFVNVDLHPAIPGVVDSSRSGCVADVFANMRSLELEDKSVREMFTSHTLEHFLRWEAIDMLRDWHRMLEPAGVLVIETPDFVRCVLWLFHPSKQKRELAKTQFYGNQWDRIDFETHRYVWSAAELGAVLRDVGFRSVTITHRTLTHHPGRDMRVTAVK